MEFVYAVTNESELDQYEQFAQHNRTRLDAYIAYLRREFAVTDLPRTILLTNRRIATQLLSDIPIPAYTNEYRIVMTPDLETWRSIYLRQLDEVNCAAKLREYYLTALSENHILQILGHELAHHSDFFLDDLENHPSNGIWFEEGMAEYISRKYFLTEKEFADEAEVNRNLIQRLSSRHGNHSLEEFGQETYSGNYASIYFEYWRSFLAVEEIVCRYGGDVHAVFASYHAWSQSHSGKTLSEWFGLLQ